jgi:hypothetical protein
MTEREYYYFLSWESFYPPCSALLDILRSTHQHLIFYSRNTSSSGIINNINKVLWSNLARALWQAVYGHIVRVWTRTATVMTRNWVTKTGSGLVIGFTDHLQIVNTCLTLYDSLQQTLSLLSLLCLHQSLSGNDLTAYVPPTLGSRTIPVPQLSASKSNSSQGLKCSSLTH